jgi:hypothetical protein
MKMYYDKKIKDVNNKKLKLNNDYLNMKLSIMEEKFLYKSQTIKLYYDVYENHLESLEAEGEEKKINNAKTASNSKNSGGRKKLLMSSISTTLADSTVLADDDEEQEEEEEEGGGGGGKI